MAVGVNQMAGDLGYLIAPVAVGGLAQGTSFSFSYVAAAIPAALVFLASLTLPTAPASAQDPRKEPMPEPTALG